MIFFISLIVSFACGLITMSLAERRGRDQGAWFVIGFLFGVFGFIILYFLPALDKSETTFAQSVNKHGSQEQNKKGALTEEREESSTALVWYYVNSNNEREGPVVLESLRDMYHSGVINQKTYVWTIGMTDWEVIENVPDIYLT